jgi:hypothetical protein
MTSLALQLKEYNKSQKKQISREVVSAMTLEELASEKITFGESKKGMTYAQAFEDAQWTEFILNRFEMSDKPEHMMFVQYVRLRLKDVQVKTKTSNQSPKPKRTRACLPFHRRFGKMSCPRTAQIQPT